MSERLILASANPGKLRELSALLGPHGFDLVTQDTLAIAACPETASSFVENALAKARHASGHGGLPAIADDSGLVVEILGGEPGVRSARYAGEAATDAENTTLLLERLGDLPRARRAAYFYCVIVYLRSPDDPTPIICEGRWDGCILDAPRGDSGFGYDPIFYLPEIGRSAAQLDARAKNALSHRGQAVRILCARLVADSASTGSGAVSPPAAML